MAASVSKICIEKVAIADVEDCNPVLVSYSHSESIEQNENVSYTMFERKNSNKRLSVAREGVAIVAKTDKLEYVGTSFDFNDKLQQDSCSRLHSYFIAEYDKTSGELTIIPTEKITLKVNFDPDVLLSKPAEEAALEETQKSYSEQMNDLTAAFGSFKKKRALDSRKLHGVKNETVAETIKSSVTAAAPFVDVVKSELEEISDLLPPKNDSADIPREIYQQDLIFPTYVLNAIDENWDAYGRILNATFEDTSKWRKEGTYPLTILNAMPIKGEQQEKIELAKAFAILEQMHNLYGKKAKDLYSMKSIFAETVPSAVSNFLIDRFTSQIPGFKRRNCPQKLRDSLAMYYLALGLMISNCRLPLSHVHQDLKLGWAKLDVLAKAIGAYVEVNVVKGEKEKFAVLKIPLNMAVNTPRKKARRH